jgi:hypothetical protein
MSDDTGGAVLAGSGASVYDPLTTVEALTDLSAVEVVATQLNDKKQNQNRAQGAPHVTNLTGLIIDIVIDTVAQGASTLEIHLIDPYWALLTRYGQAPAFIDIDDSGLLIPVDVNFPANTDRWWRLAQAAPVFDPTQPLVLIFEDRIVTLLRDVGGAKHASKNQTRAQFIYSCVQAVPEIRFVCPAITKPAGSVGGDSTEGQVDTQGIQGSNPVAQSATNPNAPPARKNPAKRPGIGRPGKRNGAVWTPSGWRYTKPIGGLTPKELNTLNPPTNTQDGGLFGGLPGLLGSAF